MKDLMGIINLSENEDYIKELTYHRPIATIPFAGRYRIIDFTLSNMVNAGIHNVAIFTQGKSRSLMDHIGTGKDWDLDRKREGLFVLNPVLNSNCLPTHTGDIEYFKDHLDYIRYSKQQYILLSRSYMVCNIDLNKAYKYHRETEADITVIYKKVEKGNRRFNDCNTLNIDKDKKVLSIGRCINEDTDNNISLEMYFMRKELLIEILENAIRTGEIEYVKQVIIRSIKDLNVNAYEFDGHLSCINSIDEYYKSNRDLLDVTIANELFHKNGLIFTKSKNEPSTKYTGNAQVKNSLIANGAIIEGRVENSIIGRGVIIGKGAVVKNSIIMNKGIIGEKAFVNNVILDKYVNITANNILSGDPTNPLVIKKGLTI